MGKDRVATETKRRRKGYVSETQMEKKLVTCDRTTHEDYCRPADISQTKSASPRMCAPGKSNTKPVQHHKGRRPAGGTIGLWPRQKKKEKVLEID